MERFRPNVVGITTVTVTLQKALELVVEVKAADPSVVTILGGVHPTLLPEQCLNEDYIDIVCIGEGPAAGTFDIKLQSPPSGSGGCRRISSATWRLRPCKARIS